MFEKILDRACYECDLTPRLGLESAMEPLANASAYHMMHKVPDDLQAVAVAGVVGPDKNIHFLEAGYSKEPFNQTASFPSRNPYLPHPTDE